MITETRSPRNTIRRLNLLGGTALMLAFGAFGGWAATTEIAGAVLATGDVVVESNVRKVQHLNGGIVTQILVKEGSVVEADQVLLRLDDTLSRATLGVVQSQLDLYAAREARLSAERDGLADIPFPETLGTSQTTFDTAFAGERKLFRSRRDALEGQRAQLRERNAQTAEEIRGLIAQQKSKDSEIGYVGEELSSVSGLYAKNLVSLARLKQLQRDQARLEGERGQLIADIARSRGKIAETALQILQLDQDFRTDVLKDLRETEAKRAELQERANAAADELRHTELRAPQAGVVYQLQAHTLGGVIGKGETVMQIAPSADPLIVEAKVTPQDIDQVEVGAAVRMRLGAGNRRTTPDLEGSVIVVSPDLTHEQSPPGFPAQQPFYLVRASISETGRKALGDLKLVPGMPVEVYIRTQDRTPLDYLLKPLREQIARTFRER